MGQDNFNYVPKGDFTLYRSGAYVRSWTGKTANARGTKALAAIAAANALDTVVCAPGAANIAGNLLKNGVNIEMMAGFVPTCTSATIGLLDDSSLGANGACTALISGWGELRRSSAATTPVGTVNITNASSNVKLVCDSIYYLSTGNLADIQTGAVNHLAGTLSVQSRRIESLGDPFGNSAAVYWENGPLQLNAQEIVNNAGVYVVWGIAGGVNLNAPTGEMHVVANDISSTYSGAQVCILDGHASARQWVRANTIYSPVEAGSGQNSGVVLSGGLGYVDALKIRGRILASTAYGAGPIAGSYVDTQKLSGAASGSGTNLVYGSAGVVDLDIMQYDDSTTPDYIIRCEGATINVKGGRMNRTTTGSGIYCSSGTVNVDNVRMSGCTTDLTQSSTGTINVTGGSGSNTDAYKISGTINRRGAGAYSSADLILLSQVFN